MTPTNDELWVATSLYNSFWKRNDPEGYVLPFESQAEAIRRMWINIARDSIELLWS